MSIKTRRARTINVFPHEIDVDGLSYKGEIVLRAFSTRYAVKIHLDITDVGRIGNALVQQLARIESRIAEARSALAGKEETGRFDPSRTGA